MSIASDILAFAHPTIAMNTPIMTIRCDLKSTQDVVFDKATVLFCGDCRSNDNEKKSESFNVLY